MRLRKIPGAEEKVKSSVSVIQNPSEFIGHWRENVFGNRAPLYVEIGTGKGSFLTANAEKYPERNFLGIERMSSVLVRAVEKEEEIPHSNLKFLLEDAEQLEEFFGAEEISGIFLNFSDPWPKERHYKRRLTYRGYLEKYARLLEKNGIAEIKTDNAGLFEFTLTELRETGWEILYETHDLYKEADRIEENIPTEYEIRFHTLGNPIMKVIARKPERAHD